MKERVYILATVRKPALLPAATLVFDTVRIGFPTAMITVQSNGMLPEAHHVLGELCRKVDARFETGLAMTQHDRWLARLLEVAHEPFWIVDTDVVFFGSLEKLGLPGKPHMAGEYQPTCIETYTQTIHVERLHTAVLWFDPVELREALRRHQSKHPAPKPFDVGRVLVHQTFVPTPEGVLFYDTAAGLYHAIGGTALPDEILERWEHLHCATYLDLVEDKFDEAPGLAAMHMKIHLDPQSARGLRLKQRAYYAKMKVGAASIPTQPSPKRPNS